MSKPVNYKDARKEKRQKFQNASPNQKKGGLPVWAVATAVIGVVVIAVGAFTLLKPQAPTQPTANTSAAAATISMTDIPSPTAVGGVITLSLKDIQEKKLVWFTYGPKNTPVLAYLSPSGKPVTAISMCEPCNSVRFHIEGNELVCNTCGSRWTLEGLKGVSGGCLSYPPDELPNTVSGDQVQFQEKDVLNWVPRV